MCTASHRPCAPAPEFGALPNTSRTAAPASRRPRTVDGQSLATCGFAAGARALVAALLDGVLAEQRLLPPAPSRAAPRRPTQACRVSRLGRPRCTARPRAHRTIERPAGDTPDAGEADAGAPNARRAAAERVRGANPQRSGVATETAAGRRRASGASAVCGIREAEGPERRSRRSRCAHRGPPRQHGGVAARRAVQRTCSVRAPQGLASLRGRETAGAAGADPSTAGVAGRAGGEPGSPGGYVPRLARRPPRPTPAAARPTQARVRACRGARRRAASPERATGRAHPASPLVASAQLPLAALDDVARAPELLSASAGCVGDVGQRSRSSRPRAAAP